MIASAILAGCTSPVVGTAVTGPKDGDQASFFAGDVAVYGQAVSAAARTRLAYLRALRRIDVCGLLTGDTLAEVGEIVSVGTLFAFDDCDAQLKVSGVDTPQFVSAQLEMAALPDASPAFRVGGAAVYPAEHCAWVVPLPMSRLPGAPELTSPARPLVRIAQIGGEDCAFTRPIASALAARVDSGTLPPRDGAVSYPARLAERDPCQVLSVVPGPVAGWNVPMTQVYRCEFTVTRGGRGVAAYVSLEPQIVGVATEDHQLLHEQGVEVYLDRESCSAVTYVDAPMRRRLSSGEYVDVAGFVTRPALTVGAYGVCDAVTEIAVAAAKVYA